MKTKNKKGISPLIATVIVIGLTIVLAAIVVKFGSDLVKGTTNDAQKQAEFSRLCQNIEVNFRAVASGTSTNFTMENNVQTPVPGFFLVPKKTDGSTDTTKNYLVGSTDMTSANSQLALNVPTANVILTLIGGLGAYAKPLAVPLTNVNPTVNPNGAYFSTIDIRPIVKTTSGDYNVCTGVQTINILSS